MDKNKHSDRRIKTVKLVKEATESADRILAAKKHADEQWDFILAVTGNARRPNRV